MNFNLGPQSFAETSTVQVEIPAVTLLRGKPGRLCTPVPVDMTMGLTAPKMERFSKCMKQTTSLRGSSSYVYLRQATVECQMHLFFANEAEMVRTKLL